MEIFMNKVLLLSVALMPSLEALSLANALTGTKKGVVPAALAQKGPKAVHDAWRASLPKSTARDIPTDLKQQILTLHIRSQEPKTKTEQAALQLLVLNTLKECGFDADLVIAAFEQSLVYNLEELAFLMPAADLKKCIQGFLCTSYNIDDINQLWDYAKTPGLCRLYGLLGLDLDKKLEDLLKKQDKSDADIAVIKNLLQADAQLHVNGDEHNAQELENLCDRDTALKELITQRINFYKNKLQRIYNRSYTHRVTDFYKQHEHGIDHICNFSALALFAGAFYFYESSCKKVLSLYVSALALCVSTLRLNNLSRNPTLRNQKYLLDFLKEPFSIQSKIESILAEFKRF